MEILDQQQTSQQNLRYAGFLIRAAALIVDSIILTIAIVIVVLVLGLFVATNAFAFNDNPAGIAVIILLYFGFLVAVILYFAIMESSEKQGTLGKIAVGIKVGDAYGNRISFGNALGRYFSKILSSMIFYIGYIMVAFDAKKQGLHDKIANTYVYYK